MVALIHLGIVRKVKISYFLRSHSHCDGDGVIGVVGGKICTENLPTFESFREATIAAFTGQGYSDVLNIIGLTDYASMFSTVARSNPYIINGKGMLFNMIR